MTPTSARMHHISRELAVRVQEGRELTEAETFARHVGDETGIVADVEDGDDPVHDGGPSGQSARSANGVTGKPQLRHGDRHERPSLKLKIVDVIV